MKHACASPLLVQIYTNVRTPLSCRPGRQNSGTHTRPLKSLGTSEENVISLARAKRILPFEGSEMLTDTSAMGFYCVHKIQCLAYNTSQDITSLLNHICHVLFARNSATNYKRLQNPGGLGVDTGLKIYHRACLRSPCYRTATEQFKK